MKTLNLLVCSKINTNRDKTFFERLEPKENNYSQDEVIRYIENFLVKRKQKEARTRRNKKIYDTLSVKSMKVVQDRLKALSVVSILEIDEKKIVFQFNDKMVVLYPYTGYFSGEKIKRDRGLEKLILLIKNDEQTRN